MLAPASFFIAATERSEGTASKSMNTPTEGGFWPYTTVTKAATNTSRDMWNRSHSNCMENHCQPIFPEFHRRTVRWLPFWVFSDEHATAGKPGQRPRFRVGQAIDFRGL